MKKTLIALAAVAVSSAAMAQVTMSGYINTSYNKSSSTAPSALGMTDAGLTFSASEDLGGGLKASGVFNLDNLQGRGATNVLNSGDSSISLSGGFGTITSSRTRSSNMAINGAVFGTSISNGFNETVFTRSEVSILSYTSPEVVKGLRVAVASVRAAAAPQAIKTNVIGATYSAGALSLGVQQKSNNGAATAATGQEDSQTEGFVRYNAGVALIGVGYGSKQTATGDAVTSYGISVPMGAITVGAEGASRGDVDFMNYGVRYALSKRTTLHVSKGSYSTATASDQDQTRVRLQHNF